MPDSGGTWFLPRLIGPARARGLALTAEPLGAEKAEAWGLIWKVVDDAALAGAAAAELCAEFARGPAVALALIKHALDETWENDLEASASSSNASYSAKQASHPIMPRACVPSWKSASRCSWRPAAVVEEP